MRRLFSTLMAIMFFSNLYCQTLIEQIESAYVSLDSTTYIENIVASFTKSKEQLAKDSEKAILELNGNTVDEKGTKQVLKTTNYLPTVGDKKIRQETDQFYTKLKSETPTYVLNLELNDNHTLKVNNSKLPFNLFYFDKHYKGHLFVYCEKGEYSWHDNLYRTFSSVLGENAPKVFRKILKKKPRYLLYCTDLEEMNTILYVIDKKIYVYRIIEMKEYDLDEYMTKYKDK